MLATKGIVEVICKAETYEGVCVNGGNTRRMDMEFPTRLHRDLFVQALDVEVLDGIGSLGEKQALIYIPM